MKTDVRLRFPNLGALSLALLEHLLDPILGTDARRILKAPLVEKELYESLGKAVQYAEERFITECPNTKIGRAVVDLPLATIPSLREHIRSFYDRPTDLALRQKLYELLVTDLPSIDKDRLESAVDKYLEILREELTLVSTDIREKLNSLALQGIQTNTAQTIELLKSLAIPHNQDTSSREKSTLDGEPPYKGLVAFAENDANLFFGRELLTSKIIARLRKHQFLALVGASGSGKSSIVRAGVIAALRGSTPLADGSLPPQGSSQWPIFVIHPTDHPLFMLAACFSHNRDAAQALSTQFMCNNNSFVDELKKVLNSSETGCCLLFVDQFEELFTLCESDIERNAFVDNLMSALELKGLRLAVALRADFYGQCARFDKLREVLQTQQILVGPMNRAELRKAIEEPALRGDWILEDGLVERLLKDSSDEPGGLPLLSHALLQTWQRRRQRLLTFVGYEKSGGVQGSIAITAQSLYEELESSYQVITRNILLQLTAVNEGGIDTRRQVSMVGLLAHFAQPNDAQKVLNMLTDARLVTTNYGVVEVAHEALIREWPLLREWLAEQRDDLLLHRQLSEAVQAWIDVNRDPSELYRGRKLLRITDWAKSHSSELSVLEREFLDTSEFEERKAAQTLARLKTYQHDVDRLEAARASLAREIHDTVLNSMKLLRDSVGHLPLPVEFVKKYDLIVDSLRRIIMDLRPAMLNYGLRAALYSLVDNQRDLYTELNKLPAKLGKSRHDIPVFDIDLSKGRDDEYPYYDEKIVLHVYRIVQEACSNAITHASARNIRVVGQLQPDYLDLTITDDGLGFDAKTYSDLEKSLQMKRFGIAGMFERAALIDAHLKIISSPGYGTTIRIIWHSTTSKQEIDK